MSLAECKKECNLKRNCSCTAYANLDVRNGGSGCLLWFGNLTDIRDFEENQDLYIRIAMTESTGSSKKRKIILVLLTSVGVVLVGLTLAVLLYGYKKKISPRAGNATSSHYNMSQLEKLKKAYMPTQGSTIYLRTFGLI
uniref:Apple domain-containing protein n=1 Tax=Lactuca sativa TaxID=4236 RepID=A0A9R1WD19_LACSA|nr:hypothetical protein LSAT_V11C200092150 [Lactuca sativa]